MTVSPAKPADAEATAAAAVSVVVPLYNGAAHIEETLTSIQRQTLTPAQVIVVDDGSSDGGGDIAGAHPIGATVVAQRNLGVAVARNRGLSLATGDWVAFLDQDDLWHPTHLERAVGWLDAHPDERIVFVREIPFTVADEEADLRDMDALAGGWAQLIAPRAGALEHLVAAADVSGSEGVERHDLRDLLAGPVSTTTSFVSDPQLLRLAGGFAPHALAMDDYWLLVNVARIATIPQVDLPTVFYRVHVSATSRTTKLGMPFLSSAVALRLGGGLIDVRQGIVGGTVGKLHRHLFLELIRSPEYADGRFRGSVDALARLLWPTDGRRRERLRARVAARAPWLRRVLRSIRPR